MPYQPYAQFQKKQEEKNPYFQFKKEFAAAEEQQQKIDAAEKFPQKYREWSGYRANRPIPRMPSEDPLLVNLGAGLKRTGQGAANLVLPRSLQPSWATDEALTEEAQNRKSLEGTPGSTVMQMTGETLPTLSLGSGFAAASSKAVQAAARAPAAVLKLTRAAGSRPVQQAVEGAISGAVTANPDDQAEAGGMSAALSVLLGRLAAGGRRAGQGVVRKSQEAMDLEQLAGQHGEEIFLPLSQAADDSTLMGRLIKGGYREALPLIPGTSRQLTKQGEEAKGVIRKIAAHESAPVGMNVPANVGDNIASFRRELKKEFDTRYLNTIKQYAFQVPSDFRDQVVARIKKALPNVDDVTLNKIATEADQHMARFSSGKPDIDGENMLNVKNAIGRMWGAAKGPEKPAVEAAQKYIDEIIETDLKVGNKAQNLQDLQTYQDLDAPYRNYLVLKRAANAAKANRGNFNSNQLARAARDPSEMLDLATTANAAMKDPAVNRTPQWQKWATVGATGILSSPMGAALMVAGGNVLSTKTMQKALMGDLASQKMIMKFLDDNPALMEEMGRAFRNTGSTQIGAHYGSP